eukprot:1295352-Amphidinium_carterae.1
MSLEDHNLANILEDTKTQKLTIVDAHYIDYSTIYMNKDLVRKTWMRSRRKSWTDYSRHIREIQRLYYDATQRKLDEDKKEKMEYPQMKQYQLYLN